MLRCRRGRLHAGNLHGARTVAGAGPQFNAVQDADAFRPLFARTGTRRQSELLLVPARLGAE
ncbi:MAG: hypothetical protein ACK52I_23040 [Pseudomonadota bacterium]